MPKTKKTEKAKSQNSFAVIETGGKQYLVRPGDKIEVEKLAKFAEDGTVVFDKVLLLTEGDKVQIGNPYIKGAEVKAGTAKEIRGRKITMLRYKSKTRRARKKGHQQTYNEVIISGF